MSSLFPLDPVFPEGFTYYPDFLSEKQETDLLREIAGISLHNMIFQGFEAKRKVASFGYDWNFEKRTLSRGKDIPAAFGPIIQKTAAKLCLAVESIGELLVTEYPIDSVINWHRDAPPFDLIAGISLASDCIFRLRPHDKSKQGRGSILSFPVKRRSLYVMEGVSRTDWQHSTAPVRQVRYSITLRTLKEK